MYDAREKAQRDRQWQLNAARLEGEERGEARGELKGKIELIRTLQAILCVPISEDQELRVLNLPQLEAMTSDLQGKIRSRTSVLR